MSDPVSAISMAIPHVSLTDGGSPVLPTDDGALGDAGASAGSHVPFVDMFKDALQSANDKGNAAGKMAEDFAAGKSDDIHGTMIASKQADIELHLVTNIRTKIVDAINDLLKTSI
jgi:flagellar hook-basal body complex protein FliE